LWCSTPPCDPLLDGFVGRCPEVFIGCLDALCGWCREAGFGRRVAGAAPAPADVASSAAATASKIADARVGGLTRAVSA
jgi:hypothetical protein